MRSKSEIFALHAAECRRKAAVAPDRMLKWLFSDLAVQWLELAATARLLEVDKKEREHFFNVDSPGRQPPPRGQNGHRERVPSGTIASRASAQPRGTLSLRQCPLACGSQQLSKFGRRSVPNRVSPVSTASSAQWTSLHPQGSRAQLSLLKTVNRRE
jgi:hypothetical protein